MKICVKCLNKIPSCVTIDNKIRNLQNRKYCLKCSPFGQHNTKKLDKKKDGFKFCTRCETEKKSSEFYKRRSGQDLSSYCKVCTNDQVLERQRAFKNKCVQYKGGKCEFCGYSKSITALEFHHIDPKQKDFNFSQFRLYGRQKRDVLPVVINELDKCILLCANCHREEHERLNQK